MKMWTAHADRYSSHGFRRGAADALKRLGAQWSTIATLGEWRSLASKGYVDLTDDLDRDMCQLLIGAELLSDDDADAQPLGAGPRGRFDTAKIWALEPRILCVWAGFLLLSFFLNLIQPVAL